ncbi:hypothetical protein KUTeg_018315 [Tegillarca granosa]|uniref:C2 domain-containing protein n=1 Tax=Tegillarca granosa TaxID=220873 RepID=A0ABQ9EHI9_TEGGR|nr:hypothetical protein KUTeg_018315 [Tegillarca granosa]
MSDKLEDVLSGRDYMRRAHPECNHNGEWPFENEYTHSHQQEDDNMVNPDLNSPVSFTSNTSTCKQRAVKSVKSSDKVNSSPPRVSESRLSKSTTGKGSSLTACDQKILSSASAIMSRHHDKKKQKTWYKKLCVGKPFKRKKEYRLSDDKVISRSVENLTLHTTNLGVLGAFVGCANSATDLPSLQQHLSRKWSSGSECSNDSMDSTPELDYRYLNHKNFNLRANVSNPELYHGSPMLRGRPKGYSLESDHSSFDVSPTVSVEDFDADDSGMDYIKVVQDSGGEDSDFLQETTLRQRQHALLQHQFYELKVWLKEGKDLVVRDSSGTSDPYVKFKIGHKQYYKSKTIYKNLCPTWDEKFVIPIEDVYQPVQVKVLDYDRGRSDDPMGSCEIELSSLDINVPTDLKLHLEDSGKNTEYMGYLLLQCTLVPKVIPEKDMGCRKSSKNILSSDSSKKLKNQIWSGVVTIVLVEGRDLMPMDDNGFSDPYVKFRLGPEKYKSKHKSKTLNPKWLEQFDLRLFDDQNKQLELTVYDHDVTGKDDFMGSGTSGAETISDLANYTANPREREGIIRKYGIVKSLENIKDIGWLQVKVFKANNLVSADIGGKSDPFCVLELDNARLQTQTEYKTLNPEWNKVFTFNIRDIHSVLEVTVYDEDRDKKVEFLGKVLIPLLKIKQGERKWYALKDKKLIHKSRGAIQLELDYVYNPVKAAIRTVNPKEEKYMQPDPKFKIAIMKKNIDRVSQIAAAGVEGGKFLQSCFDWESKPRSITAFIVSLSDYCVEF